MARPPGVSGRSGGGGGFGDSESHCCFYKPGLSGSRVPRRSTTITVICQTRGPTLSHQMFGIRLASLDSHLRTRYLVTKLECTMSLIQSLQVRKATSLRLQGRNRHSPMGVPHQECRAFHAGAPPRQRSHMGAWLETVVTGILRPLKKQRQTEMSSRCQRSWSYARASWVEMERVVGSRTQITRLRHRVRAGFADHS